MQYSNLEIRKWLKCISLIYFILLNTELKADMGKYNKTLHYNNQQSKLYWVEAPYNNFWCWLFWGTLHTTFKNVVVGLVLVGTKIYSFDKQNVVWKSRSFDLLMLYGNAGNNIFGNSNVGWLFWDTAFEPTNVVEGCSIV